MSTPEIERAYTASWSGVPGVEVRNVPGKSGRTIGGYAAVFGSRSDPRLGFSETVERSFFNKSQGDGWPGVVARYEHDPKMILGAARSGTLRLRADNYGLDYEVDIAESRSDVYESIMRGDIRSSSFAFMAYEDQWRHGDNGYPVRHLISGRLIDVAPTAQPAYPDCTVALRSLAIQTDASYEDVERDARAGELNRYLVRTDNRDIAPTPALIEARNQVAAQHVMPADLARRLEANRDRGVNNNRDGRLDLNRRIEANRQRAETYDLEVRRAANHRKTMVGATETRSRATDYPRDDQGNAIYWHPARQ